MIASVVKRGDRKPVNGDQRKIEEQDAMKEGVGADS